MDELITLLLHLLEKVPYLNEEAHDAELDLLRVVESKLNVTGVVPPKAGPINAPVVPVVPPDPGPVAEPVPPALQPLPPTSPELGGQAPEETNAFADPTAPDAPAPA